MSAGRASACRERGQDWARSKPMVTSFSLLVFSSLLCIIFSGGVSVGQMKPERPKAQNSLSIVRVVANLLESAAMTTTKPFNCCINSVEYVGGRADRRQTESDKEWEVRYGTFSFSPLVSDIICSSFECLILWSVSSCLVALSLLPRSILLCSDSCH